MSGAPVYHLLDHCNARNAAELARTDLDARVLGTLEWVPPSGMVCAGPYGPDSRPLGYGDKISCITGDDGETGYIDAATPRDSLMFGDTYPGESAQRNDARRSRHGGNICRPFDEAHAANDAAGHDGNGANPHDTKRTLSEPYEPGDKVHYQLKPENMGFLRHTPPTHGHGAPCGCVRDDLGSNVTFLPLGRAAVGKPNSPRWHSAALDCPHCSGTGRIICDDERAGRVSPSHAAGGYAEWQRRTMESAVAVRSGARPLGRITNMRSVDGFVVGDIELADGSVVVERLMRSPFSSSEIGDAEPATTERE